MPKGLKRYYDQDYLHFSLAVVTIASPGWQALAADLPSRARARVFSGLWCQGWKPCPPKNISDTAFRNWFRASLRGAVRLFCDLPGVGNAGLFSGVPLARRGGHICAF